MANKGTSGSASRYPRLTPAEKRHALKAEALEEQAAKAIDNTKTGQSPKAAKLILNANIERQKAGLIKGALKK